MAHPWERPGPLCGRFLLIFHSELSLPSQWSSKWRTGSRCRWNALRFWWDLGRHCVLNVPYCEARSQSTNCPLIAELDTCNPLLPPQRFPAARCAFESLWFNWWSRCGQFGPPSSQRSHLTLGCLCIFAAWSCFHVLLGDAQIHWTLILP